MIRLERLSKLFPLNVLYHIFLTQLKDFDKLHAFYYFYCLQGSYIYLAEKDLISLTFFMTASQSVLGFAELDGDSLPVPVDIVKLC